MYSKGCQQGGSRVLIEIRLISKKVSQAEPEYINMHPPPPPINALDLPLVANQLLPLPAYLLNISFEIKLGESTLVIQPRI